MNIEHPEVLLEGLVDRWLRLAGEAAQNDCLPAEVDDIASAVLMLVARVQPGKSPGWGRNEVGLALDWLCRNRPGDWRMYDLSWRLCLKRGFRRDLPAMDLVTNLTHASSGLRDQMLELAWIIRERLPRELVALRLMVNIAIQLCGVEKSIGLAYYLTGNARRFQTVAEMCRRDEYCGKEIARYREQFDCRIAEALEVGLEKFQVELKKREAYLAENYLGVTV